MKLLSLQDGGFVSATPPDAELEALGALERLRDGHPFYISDRWVFPEVLATTRGPQKTTELDIREGFTERDGSPGSCDVHWYEVWADEEIIKRSICIEATGAERHMAAEAGQIG